jgi:cardiolipin synthase
VEVRTPPVVSNRVFTIPNALSLLRLAAIPVFVWLVLVPEADGWALIVLLVSGATDYIDGKLARRWNQITRVGRILDPLADRLYILAVVGTLTVREIVPLWFTGLLLARDVLLLLCYPVLRWNGYGVLPVNHVGKAATFSLLYAFPLLLLAEATGSAVGETPGAVATLAQIFGWAFAIWGTGLYWWAGVLYVVQTRRLVRAARASRMTAARDTALAGAASEQPISRGGTSS